MFRDRDFFVIFAGFILWYLFGFIALVGGPFMSLHFWGLKTEHLAWFSVASLVALPVGFFLVPPLTRAFDKKPIVIASSLTYLLLANIPICLRLLDVSWYPDNTSPWVLIINLGVAFAGGCAATGVAITYPSMCADLTDAHEYRTGQRREGALFAARSFANKTAGAMGLLIGGAILDAIAFPRNAPYGTVPDDIVWNPGFFAGPVRVRRPRCSPCSVSGYSSCTAWMRRGTPRWCGHSRRAGPRRRSGATRPG